MNGKEKRREVSRFAQPPLSASEGIPAFIMLPNGMKRYLEEQAAEENDRQAQAAADMRRLEEASLQVMIADNYTSNFVTYGQAGADAIEKRLKWLTKDCREILDNCQVTLSSEEKDPNAVLMLFDYATFVDSFPKQNPLIQEHCYVIQVVANNSYMEKKEQVGFRKKFQSEVLALEEKGYTVVEISDRAQADRTENFTLTFVVRPIGS